MRLIAPVALVLIGLALAAPAQAQSGGDPVAECRAAHGENAPARIACLEAAIARMQGRVVVAEQQAAEAQQQAAAAQQEAGSSRPSWSIPGFRAREQAEQAESIRVAIAAIRYGRDGFGIFTTSEGQVWRETVAAPRRRWLDPARTYEAEISRSVFGGFRMNVDGIRWEYKVEPLN